MKAMYLLDKIHTAAKKCREKQNEYFAEQDPVKKRKELLPASKKLEKELDALIAQIDTLKAANQITD